MSPSLDSTMGAVLIGGVVSSIFYGITSLQTFFYFNNYSSDKKIYRVSVVVLWTLDTCHIAFVVYLLYHYTISIPGRMFVPEWSSSALIIVTNISDLIIRLIFLYRIWHLSQKSCIRVAPIAIIVLCTAALGIVYGIKMSTLNFSSLQRISWALYATLSGDVIADVAISLSLCVLFAQMRSGIPRTDNFLNLLILYTINTGLLTSLIAVGTLVTYAIMPQNYIFMGIFLVLGKASFNSLLATLNARSHLRPRDCTQQNVPKSATVPSLYPSVQATSCWTIGEDTIRLSAATSSAV